jgi:hypothetical protein
MSLEIPIAGSAIISIIGHFIAARLLSAESAIEPRIRSYVLGHAALDPQILPRHKLGPI